MDIKDIIGVIFDFNGTMFFDRELQLRAWATYVEELSGVSLSRKGIERHIDGRSPKEILEHFLGYELGQDTLEQLCEEKESIYRRICMEEKESFVLAPGLEKFLDYLDEYNVPRTIATTAPLSNVMFYFEHFDLYRWFDPEKLVCHDKRLRDKPFPDLYLVACKKLSKEPARCLVFEDSIAGITAAKNAGIKNIVGVRGDNPMLDEKSIEGVKLFINDYRELNENLDV